ncbi:MAG TPA: hypothetical protein VGP82_11305 [Ktedonobacterales bacterium]|nr:hypothetical protein [Ktedonobacterales bacterium]
MARTLEVLLSIITRYMRWPGHDAGGTLSPEDVLVGILNDGVWHLPSSWLPLAPGETLVYVPPQWIGDWETGHRLAPGYQHVWRVPLASLCPALCRPLLGPYRPSTLPPSAAGPIARPKWSRSRRERSRSLQVEEPRRS